MTTIAKLNNKERAALALLWRTDGYKIGHKDMYAPGTEFVQSNLTARGSRIEGVDRTVFFGLQAYIKRVNQDWDNFFHLNDQEIDNVLQAFDQRVTNLLQVSVGTDHIRALWELGYLPIRISALKEGTLVPIKVPYFTVENTVKGFGWLVTGYFETDPSANLWQPITNATLAYQNRLLLNSKAVKSHRDISLVDFQGHDFSYRGMAGNQASAASGAAHLLSFSGSDVLPAEDYVEEYYSDSTGMGTVPATEHSVMVTGICGHEDKLQAERETFERLLDTFPSGLLSVVSDTFDLWKVLTEIVPSLKEKILARDGKLVIRPDSGNPELIVCGDPNAPENSPARKGVINLLWDEFGGTETNGFKDLDTHVGIIYGDSITPQRANDISENLISQGYASTNLVMGFGSYQYHFSNSRDTFGMAMKATWAQINGVPVNLLKDPITDDGTKKSATGRLSVISNKDNELELIEKATPEQEAESELEKVFENGVILRDETYTEIRNRLHKA